MTGNHSTDRHRDPPPRASLGRVILYVRNVEEVAEFYALHFGFRIRREDGDRIVELEHPGQAGSSILLHPLGRGRRTGQTSVKLVFDVCDVEAFCTGAARRGLPFGKVHKADGYDFANAKDPAGNSVSVSSRAYRNHASVRDRED